MRLASVTASIKGFIEFVSDSPVTASIRGFIEFMNDSPEFTR